MKPPYQNILLEKQPINKLSFSLITFFCKDRWNSNKSIKWVVHLCERDRKSVLFEVNIEDAVHNNLKTTSNSVGAHPLFGLDWW